MSNTCDNHSSKLTLILLTRRIWWFPDNASKWQMGFNSALKGLTKYNTLIHVTHTFVATTIINKYRHEQPTGHPQFTNSNYINSGISTSFYYSSLYCTRVARRTVSLLFDLHSFCCHKHNFTLSLKAFPLVTSIRLYRKVLSKAVNSF